MEILFILHCLVFMGIHRFQPLNVRLVDLDCKWVEVIFLEHFEHTSFNLFWSELFGMTAFFGPALAWPEVVWRRVHAL